MPLVTLVQICTKVVKKAKARAQQESGRNQHSLSPKSDEPMQPVTLAGAIDASTPTVALVQHPRIGGIAYG